MSPMSKRPMTKAESRERAGRKARLVLGGAIGMLVALFVAYNLLGPPPRLDQYLCPEGNPPAGHTILLIDRTDFFTALQLEALRSWIGRTKDEVRRGEMLSIRTITSNPEDGGRPIFIRCNPGDGSAVSRLWGNPDKRKALWKESFEGPLMKTLEQLQEKHETATSAILETIDTVMWDKLFSSQTLRRRLIVISDLIQNMPSHNQYKTLIPVPTFLKSDVGRHLKEKVWRNVRVDLGYLPNEKWRQRQGAAHIAFWKELFAVLGAAEVVVIPDFVPPRVAVGGEPRDRPLGKDRQRQRAPVR